MGSTLLLEEVFRTEGLPEFTFVPAPNYNEILLDIRRPGKPVILEGQSGTGKTTCVRRITTELDDDIHTEYLTARNPVHISRIESIVNNQTSGRYVIDDFHRLAQPLQEQIADLAKLSAEQRISPSEANHNRDQSSRLGLDSTCSRHSKKSRYS